MATLKFENIEKKYLGNVIAVKDFNLEINDKEFIVLVGPSGCGKSTLLRMIAGLENITDGKMYMDGKLINNILPKERNIAMVFQNYALYPHMSVYKNMSFGLKMRKVKSDIIEAKIEKASRFLNINELLDRKPSELSGGQRQRVALGRAMVRDAKVFLLDEPLSNLDANLRTQMRTEIIKLHKATESTFVYVTHDQTEAMTMADRIVVMRDGYLQQVDTPINLYNHPQNIFVAGFIGTPQMNFMEVELCFDNEGCEEKEAEIAIKFQNYKLHLDREKYNDRIIKKYINKKLIMGIRAEDIHCEMLINNSESKEIMKFVIEMKEVLGYETQLYLECNGVKIIAKISGNIEIAENQSVYCVFNMDKIHLFNEDTGENVEYMEQMTYIS